MERSRDERGGGRGKKLVEVWAWLTGDSAKYCRTCRANQAQTNNPIDCGQCEGRCPDLMPENRAAFGILMAGRSQMRVGFGGFYGFDYLALRMVAQTLGISIRPATLRKIQAVEQVILKKQGEKKDG